MSHRWSRTIVRESLTFHRSATELGTMLRCSLGVTSAFILAWAAHHTESGPIMAVGAFICGFISLEGIYRSRIKLIVATALGIATSSFIGELAVNSLPALVLLTAGVGYVNGIFAQVSRLAGAVSLYISVTFIIFSHVPLSLHANFVQSTLLLCGAAIQIVLLIAFYPLSRFNVERHALAAVFVELSRFADPQSGEFQKAPPALKLIAARQVLADPQPFARTRDIARFKRLLHDAEMLRNRIAGLHALQNVLANEQKLAQVDFLQSCVAQLKAVADILTGRLQPEALTAIDATARTACNRFEVAFAHDGVSLAIAHSAIIQLRDAIQGASVIATSKFSKFLFVASPRPAQYVESRLNWRSRDAIRLAIVLAIAMLLGHTVFVASRGYWIALTAAFVLKSDLRSTFVRGVSRIGGTLIGAVLASCLTALHPSALVLESAMILLGAICYATFLANYGIFTISVTIFVIFFLTLLGLPSEPNISARVVDTLVGGGLAMVGYVVFPTWTQQRTREVLAELLEVQGNFADAVLGAYMDPHATNREHLETLRTRAWKLRIDAETLIDRTRSEPQRTHSIGIERAFNILAATQSFALVNLAMESGLDSRRQRDVDDQLFRLFRTELAREMHALIASLRTQTEPEKPWNFSEIQDRLQDGFADDDELAKFLRIHCLGYLASITTLRELCSPA